MDRSNNNHFDIVLIFFSHFVIKREGLEIICLYAVTVAMF